MLKRGVENLAVWVVSNVVFVVDVETRNPPTGFVLSSRPGLSVETGTGSEGE